MYPISSFSNHQYSQSPPYYRGFAPYDSSDINRTPSRSEQNETVKTLGLAALLQVVASALQKGSSYLSKKLSAGMEFTTPQNVVKVARDMIHSNNLNITAAFIDQSNKNQFIARYGLNKELDNVAKGLNAFYVDKLKLAVAPKSKPSLILHELGHAANTKNVFTKLLQKSRRYAGYAPMALLIANGMLSNKNDGKKSFIERNAGILGFCAFLPTIIEEGLASFKGIKAAKKVLGNVSNLKVLKKNYALALGTYILAGIGLGVASKQTVILDGKV